MPALTVHAISQGLNTHSGRIPGRGGYSRRTRGLLTLCRGGRDRCLVLWLWRLRFHPLHNGQLRGDYARLKPLILPWKGYA